MAIIAILCGILGFAIGAAGTGIGAAKILEAAHGSREGYAGMVGVFYFGPLGGIAGALLGIGLALRFGGGPATWSKGLLIAAAIIAGFTGIALAVTASPNDNRPNYSYVVQFELEFPAAALAGIDIPGPNAMWGAAGADLDDKPISQFFDKKCEGGACLLNGSVAAAGPMNNFRINVHLGQKSYRFPLALPEVVNSPADWSPWQSIDDARVRWQIVSR